jgi:hypothetical protein
MIFIYAPTVGQFKVFVQEFRLSEKAVVLLNAQTIHRFLGMDRPIVLARSCVWVPEHIEERIASRSGSLIPVCCTIHCGGQE